ncbi:pyridoxal phosphate-dependent transferase [Zopfochytrium polystomum]|nr:pyridoxal phosphate-dependent transferase [Zopfochytrium polystomum]
MMMRWPASSTRSRAVIVTQISTSSTSSSSPNSSLSWSSSSSAWLVPRNQRGLFHYRAAAPTALPSQVPSGPRLFLATNSANHMPQQHMSTAAAPKRSRTLTLESMNKDILRVEYAVRGEIAIRADDLRKQLAEKPGSLPFKSIVNCNIGNPQQLRQKPITFFRQVAALVDYPDLLEEENLATTKKLFAGDAIARAKSYLKAVGSTGAYSHSQGVPIVRQEVAKFILDRDGFPSDPDNIFLTAGASPGVQLCLQAIIAHQNVGVMIPIPQYPLYSATVSFCNGKAVPYYLDESSSWGLSVEELRRSLKEGQTAGVEVRALAVINPGNPTGQCLSEKNMSEIIDFCHENRLILLADEVYQTNVYEPNELPFHSFKKVLKSKGSNFEDVELISFHSVSKGMVGECGRRGGYFECTGIDPKVKDQLYKMSSISLCPPVQGQLMVGLMVNPPKQGDESFPLYNKEMTGIYESLRRRAVTLRNALNKLEGVSCNPAQGAMYLFPTITLPPKAVEAAKAAGKQPDEFYCLELLNNTGVCVVPGSGFLQKEGTWHFRSTFLAPEDEMDEFANSLTIFHKQFLDKYR